MDLTFYQTKFNIYQDSINVLGDEACFIIQRGDADMLCITGRGTGYPGQAFCEQDRHWSLSELDHSAAEFLRLHFPFCAPTAVLNQEITFGVGDRLGLAGDGLLRVFQEYDAFPVLAQQSMREMSLTRRTMADVIDSATFAVYRTGYRRGFGADGDHLKDIEDIREAVSCGYTMITLDCSDHINNDAATQTDAALADSHALTEAMKQRYLNRRFEIGPGVTLTYDKPSLRRICAIYQDAIRFIDKVYYDCLCGKGRKIDFEISIDETLTVTSALAHFFVANELKIRGVRFATMAPRFSGEFQKGIDYIGDLNDFRKDVRLHCAISNFFGYKLSFHSGSDKFSAFPIIADETKGRFHVKTSGTNWLEAMRVIAQCDPELFRDIYHIAETTFEKNRANYHVTPDLTTIPDVGKLPDHDLPRLLDLVASRQVLHISYGEVLADRTMKARIYQTLRRQRPAYGGALYRHIGRHAETLGIPRGSFMR